MGTERMTRQGLLTGKAFRGVAVLALAPFLLAVAMATPAPLVAQTGQPGITITKVANPFGSLQDFNFSGDLGAFDLDDDGDATLPNSMTFNVQPGAYTVTEASVPGWVLSNLVCADPTQNSTTDTGAATATIVLDGTETVTCTFTNTQLATLIIDKVTFPSGDPTKFDFTLSDQQPQVTAPGAPPQSLVQTFSLADEDPTYEVELAPGFYSVTETVPAGWDLTDSSCDSEDFPGDIFLQAGQTVTCTFVNTTNVESNLGFIKLFDPDTIGPGSTSTLTFTITNPDGIPAGLLTFSDDLPAGMTIAGFPNPTSTCGGIVDAPAGGTRMGFSFGSVAGFGSCNVSVDVTTSTVGVSTNTSNELTSTDGIAVDDGYVRATADLTVDTTLPGFSKSFAPSTVALGGRSTLTFTINNSANASGVLNLDFTDNLPQGMEIADPANASTTCGTATIPPTLTADAGTSVVVLDANGTAAFPAVAAGATCTVTVDVMTTGAGLLGNVSGNLLAEFVAAGKASATLEVTTDPIHLTKDFTDDPVTPGGTVTLEFGIFNFDRLGSATGIGFTDDLTTLVPALAGLTFDSLLANDCGGSVSGAGGTTIGFTGGTLGPEASCNFRVSLSVPAGATPGAYANTTGAITADIGGSMVTGNVASEDLFVGSVPLLTKSFLPNPVGSGSSTDLEFTIENTSTTSAATDIAFIDELTTFLGFPVSVTLPATPCGGGSSISIVSLGTERQGLSLTGGSLAAGSSCTFIVTVDIPLDQAPGTYVNVTGEITATVDGETVIGNPATAAFDVLAPPMLIKDFLDDPVQAGDTVTLQFTLRYNAGIVGDSTSIAFTDDLRLTLPGLSAVGLPATGVCAGTGTIAGTTNLSFSGGTLSPGEECQFNVTLQVPAGVASGAYTNTTSNVTADVLGLPVIGPVGEDDLQIAGLKLTKTFTNDPVIPGGIVTLEFTLENISSGSTATDIVFTDNLDDTLANLTGDGVTVNNVCSAGDGTLRWAAGNTFLIFEDGILGVGGSCTFSVDLDVQAGAASDTYQNTTSLVSATIDGVPNVLFEPGTDELTVDSNLLQLTKEFTDDPVAPGDTVTLEFTLTNLDPNRAASDIDFTDDLGAALAGLTFDSVLLNDCGATISGTGTDTVTVDDASLTAGGSCTIGVSLTVPGAAAANIYTNTTSAVTGTIGGFAVDGDAASDELTLLDLLLFTKSFDGPTTATGTSVLTFTITNPGQNTVTDLAFLDDLSAVIAGLVATGLPLSDVCGSGSEISGTSFLAFAGGNLPPNGGTCTFDVDLAVPVTATAGTFPNTTSDLLRSGLVVSTPATADLTIEPAPTFAKVFGPNPISLGETSTLTFAVDNSASALAAGSLDFIDNLPAGTNVAAPPSASTTCTGGTLTAAAGSGVITYSGGSIAAGASCTVSVDVTGTLGGSHINTTGDLTSSSGNSGTASDTLTVTALNFDKHFAPDTIGPGSTTLLRFDIVNDSAALVENVSFTDVLPAGVLIATPSSAFSDCTDGTLSVPDGGTIISLSGARVGAGASCVVTVNVTAAAAGTYDNLSGELTSSVGSGGTAAATLSVDAAHLGFSKTFAPNPIQPGGTSVLTLTITNDDAVSKSFVTFTDPLPAGMVIATPANVSNTCGGTLTSAAGTSSITLFGGSVAGMSSCSIDVDVTASTAGLFVNTTSDVTSGSPTPVSGGFATAALDVKPDFLIKVFTDDPVEPGGTVTLLFTINNPSRDYPATDISFTDDLDAVLPGTPDLAVSGALPTSPCGAGSTLVAAPVNVLTLTGGSLPAEGACSFNVILAVPAGAPRGSHTNTTSSITASIDGATETGGPATDLLVVETFPILTKEFTDDPVGAGGSVTLEFTITNTSTASTLSGISFVDELTTFLPFPIAVTLPPVPDPPCGVGSSIAIVSVGFERQGLELTDGSLDQAGTAGASCTFSVGVTIPIGFPAGVYANTTSPITAGLDFFETTVTGPPAIDDLVVVAGPFLRKEFTDDPVQPGDQVTLEFTLVHDSLAPGNATGVTFTDNLAAVVPTLMATGLPLMDVCGPGNGSLTGSAGDTLLTFAGATLTPGQACTFSVVLSVPVTAPSGIHTNTTSNVVATVLGIETTENPASNDLRIGGLVLTKEFTDDPVIAGGAVTLEFVITNDSPDDFTGISFDDDLDTALAGLNATGLPLVDACDPDPSDANPGTGTLAGTNSLSFTGGELASGESCIFRVTLQVPAATLSGTYVNRTDSFRALPGGSTQLFFPNATDNLVVANEQLLLTKEFIDDPVIPGGTVTLEFSFSTLGVSDSASDLAFSDDLGAALAGLVAVPPFNTGTCGGSLIGTSVLDYSGGSFSGGECSFSVTVQVPAAVPFGTTITNTTSQVTGTIEGLPVTGEPASDDLLIDFFVFTKFFDGLTKPTGTPVLTFMIENLSTTDPVTDLSFTDNLNAVIPGLVATSLPVEPCGLGSSVIGASVLTMNGGNLLPGGSCTFSIDLLVPANAPQGDFLNTTSDLQILGVPGASPATALLSVEPSPLFGKAFLPDFILSAGRSALTFLIDNTSAFPVTDLAFTDNLPSGIVVAQSADVGTTCPNATLTAVEGSGVINFSGGELPVGGSCITQVDVTGVVPGVYVNTSGPLSSSSGLSGAAIDTLVIVDSGEPCLAPDGDDLTIQDETVTDSQEFVVCDTITVGPNVGVLGPNGDLSLRAGVRVEIEEIVVGIDGTLTISIESVLIP